jgi:ribonucleoside-diphosphate reductase alpha chain
VKAKNSLTALGRKIFLDRYALKDAKKETLKIDDTVIVVVNKTTGQREIGKVSAINGNNVSVELEDGTNKELSIEQLDKPIETDPSMMIERVATALGVHENTDIRSEWVNNFKWLLDDWRFVPAGRILTGAGTDQNLTFYNCYVIPSPSDSRGGIMETLGHMTEIMSRGGGVGINISSLRPHHAYVKGVNGRSSGSVSWGALYSYVTGLIEQGGSRRGALMLILNDSHPDIMDFISSKREMGQITNANISVAISDAFMEAVKADGDWNLVFPDTNDPDYDKTWKGDLNAWKMAGKSVITHKTVKARVIWDAIIESAWSSAEPGIFFVDRYNKMSNSYYYSTIQCTNPCGEQGLPSWGVCNLGALNLSKFVDKGNVDWDSLRKGVHYAVRFLDNIIDTTPYFFDVNKDQQMSERRIGLGTMGLAEMMISLKIRYGSEESEKFIDKLFKFIAVESYLASSDYAKEKGSFPLFDADKYLKSGFLKTMPKEVRDRIKENGIRNVTLLTQAPTGTTGTMVGTSTGIEPYYFWEWERKGRMGSHTERVPVYDEWIKTSDGKKLPDYFVTAMDLSPEDHVKVQAAIQKWVDSSISKTSNTPNHYTISQTKDLYQLMYDTGCKGGTIYRDGSRDEQVLYAKKDEDKPVEKTDHIAEIKPRVRPTVLFGTTYRKHTPIGTAYITVNAGKGAIEEPFEVFINVAKVGSDVAADAEGLGRLISLILRMPSPLSPVERVGSVIGQLRSIGSGRHHGFGKNRVMSLPDAVAQVLEEHIGKANGDDYPVLPDEEDELATQQIPFTFSEPEADLCPVCGNATFMYIEGCKKCHSCGHSEC